MVRGYTDEHLLMKASSIHGFEDFPVDYWILGVRSKSDTANGFDDKFYVYKGVEFIMVTTGTTNSGVYGLLNFKKWNSKGTAVVKSNEWYYDLWKPGMHKRKMKALVQNNRIKVYRDNNMDDKNDETGSIYEGYYGINFHTVTYKAIDYIRSSIGVWSVGCQTPNNTKDYYKILDKVYSQKATTYCLLKEF
jgi:hypothetical protein